MFIFSIKLTFAKAKGLKYDLLKEKEEEFCG